MDERTIAGAQYVYTFYNEVEELTNQTSIYQNLILEFKEKYGLDNIEKLTDDEKRLLMDTIQKTRYHVNRINFKFNSLKTKLSLDDNPQIKESYDKIKNTLIINRTDLETYTQQMNNILVSSVIEKILQTRESIMEELYGTGSQENKKGNTLRD